MMNIDMQFPGGRAKALILSFDDGTEHDRRLVDLLNKHGLKGTFHLNSGRLGGDGLVRPDELASLYAGHEVSAHTVNHFALTELPENEIIAEVVADRETLERLTGRPVRGMSYPFGAYNPFVLECLRDTSMEYARTVIDSGGFDIPEDFLAWHPTIHQFGSAGYEGNSPDRDAHELEHFFRKIDDFLASTEPGLLYIWGHSWELGDDEQRWANMERTFDLVGRRDDVCSLTHIGLVDYIKAFRSLEFSADNGRVTNPSAQRVFVSIAGQSFVVDAGETIEMRPVRRVNR